MVKEISDASQLKQIMKAKERIFKKAYVEAIKSRLANGAVIKYFEEQVMSVVIDMQGEYFGSSVSDDPTSLVPNQVSAVRKEVTEQMSLSAANLTEGVNQFQLTIISDSFLGISDAPSKNSPEPPIKWMSYFLMGGPLGSGLYWVPAETAEALGIRDSSGGLGRFGKGFLIKATKGHVAKLNARLLGAKPIVIHPQSGKSGNPDWFANVLTQVDLDVMVLRPALNMAMQKLGRSS